MDLEYIALQGGIFEVALTSMYGSADYGWCVAGLPQGIILTGTSDERTDYGRSPVIRKFYFGAVYGAPVNTQIHFVLARMSNLSDVAARYTANVRIISSNTDAFVPYSENVTKVAQPYGMVGSVNEANLKYGYPCMEMTKDARPYGMVGSVCDVNLKYGYPGCC